MPEIPNALISQMLLATYSSASAIKSGKSLETIIDYSMRQELHPEALQSG
jgi:hypothetical protein